MAKYCFGPALSTIASMKTARRSHISRRPLTRVTRAQSSETLQISVTCSRTRNFVASSLLFRGHCPWLNVHAERRWSVVTGLTVDGDAAVVVRVVYACRDWRSYTLGAPIGAADRAFSGRKRTTRSEERRVGKEC